jgi:hypothetical protein
MAVLEAQVPVMHRVFVQNTGNTGRHGSAAEGTLSDPIARYALDVYPAHWARGVTLDPVDIDTAARTVIDMLMDVPDPSVYKKRDEVLINGIAFVVQGLPEITGDWAEGMMPLPEYDDMFGGVVHIRRVT